jgi:hypothetical protein
VFHYSARVEKGDRFEVCVATNEMKEASWKYGYRSQIILDGTFQVGVCDKRLLLFIVMGVDENKRGVPLAFLFFSAPSGNQQSSAGYDTDIIEKLLRVVEEVIGGFSWRKTFLRPRCNHGHRPKGTQSPDTRLPWDCPIDLQVPSSAVLEKPSE